MAEEAVTGRTPISWTYKINPIWWFGNIGDPTAPDWYMPGKPSWLRNIFWYLRNPLENFGSYVIGVADRNYTVYSNSPFPVMSNEPADVGKTGLKTSVIKLGLLRLPYISYSGTRVLYYAGWQPGGFFGFKFNILKSPVQGV